MERDKNLKSGLPLYCIVIGILQSLLLSIPQDKIKYLQHERSVAVFDCIGRSTEWTTVNHANWKPQSVRKYDAEI